MRKRISLQQNLINHIGLVIDGSASMSSKQSQVISVVDDLIKFLGEESVARNQETRVTMYVFGSDSQAACYDIDVLRSPSLKGLYEATGMGTALIDSTYVAVDEMRKTATLHGDHAFLLYVVTDGYENASERYPTILKNQLESLPDNWTVACLVPDRRSQQAVLKLGFTLENTQMWDINSSEGISQVGNTIRNATTNYYNMRASGVRSTRGLFSVDTSALDTNSISSALSPLSRNSYETLHVNDGHAAYSKDVVEGYGFPYVNGSVFYQLVKTEHIQPQKVLLVRDKATQEVYGGRDVRRVLGLPDHEVKVEATHHPKYDIFVQSTAPNRKLMPNTDAILMTKGYV